MADNMIIQEFNLQKPVCQFQLLSICNFVLIPTKARSEDFSIAFIRLKNCYNYNGLPITVIDIV